MYPFDNFDICVNFMIDSKTVASNFLILTPSCLFDTNTIDTRLPRNPHSTDILKISEHLHSLCSILLWHEYSLCSALEIRPRHSRTMSNREWHCSKWKLFFRIAAESWSWHKDAFSFLKFRCLHAFVYSIPNRDAVRANFLMYDATNNIVPGTQRNFIES